MPVEGRGGVAHDFKKLLRIEEVTVTRLARAGQQAAERLKPDLILVDISMDSSPSIRSK